MFALLFKIIALLKTWSLPDFTFEIFNKKRVDAYILG